MTELRERLLNAPRWVLGVVAAAPFGLVMGVEAGLRRGRWTDALIEGVLAGSVYGVIMAFVVHRRYGRYREAIGGVRQRDVRRAAREARRGKVPEDPEARRAAYRLLDLQLGELRRQRKWAPVFFVLLLALSVFLAVSQSAWWWCITPVWLGFAAMYFVYPHRLEPRLELLRD